MFVRLFVGTTPTEHKPSTPRAWLKDTPPKVKTQVLVLLFGVALLIVASLRLLLRLLCNWFSSLGYSPIHRFSVPYLLVVVEFAL